MKIDGSRAGDTTVTYDKGGWVFWMLLNEMGRERTLEGLRSFIAHYKTNRDHPVLQDLVRLLCPFAADPEAYDAFVAQWFFDVVLLRYETVSAELEHAEGDDGLFELRARIRNAGTGRMPIEVAVSRGDRFPEASDEAAPDAEPAEPYLEGRARIVLDPGKEAEVVLLTEFDPERLVVDPDALVLQANRARARREL